MPKSPTEPTNIVLEQLRLMRGEIAALDHKFTARFDAVDDRFASLEAEIKGLKTAVRSIGHQVLAEVYKANKTFASFANLEARLEAVERKVFA